MMRYTRTHLNKFDRTHYEKVDIYDAIPYTDSDIGHKHTLGIYVPRSSSLLSGEEQFEYECDHVLTEDNINRMQSASPPSPSDGRFSSSSSSDSFYSAELQSEVEITSCAIVTTIANPKMARIHHRLPVILEPEDWPLWLGEQGKGASKLMKPVSDKSLDIKKVSSAVNSNRSTGAELWQPVSP